MSSVYFWDLDDGFAGVVLLKKSMYIERVLARAYRKNTWARLTNYLGGDSDSKREKRRCMGFDSCI